MVSVQRLTTIMLDRLAHTPQGKDMDEKEIRMLGSIVTKSLRIWEKALAAIDHNDAGLEKELQRVKNQIGKTPTVQE